MNKNRYYKHKERPEHIALFPDGSSLSVMEWGEDFQLEKRGEEQTTIFLKVVCQDITPCTESEFTGVTDKVIPDILQKLKKDE
jgi:hypothetical protein